MNISCPNNEEDGYVRAYASIGDRQYSSDEGNGFDVIIDGETYSNPFFTDCRVCGNNFTEFWEALRKANNLKLAAGGKTVNLPTKSISSVLQPLGNGKQLPLGVVRQPARDMGCRRNACETYCQFTSSIPIAQRFHPTRISR